MARVGLLSTLVRLFHRGKKDRAPFGPLLPHTEDPVGPREKPEPSRAWIEVTPFRCSVSGAALGAALGAAESCSVYHSGTLWGTVLIARIARRVGVRAPGLPNKSAPGAVQRTKPITVFEVLFRLQAAGSPPETSRRFLPYLRFASFCFATPRGPWESCVTVAMMAPRRRSDAPLNARPAANVRLAPVRPRTPRTQTSSVLDHQLEVLERERALAARETRLEAREGQIADDRQRVEAMQQSLQEESKELREKMEHESKALREREKAIHEQMQHESKALREREAALREREAAIREREGAIHAREGAFHEREGALRERESKLERRTLPPSVRSADEKMDHNAASSEP